MIYIARANFSEANIVPIDQKIPLQEPLAYQGSTVPRFPLSSLHDRALVFESQLTLLLHLPCSYTGGRKADDFFTFIQQKLDSDKGFARVEILDELARQFKNAPDLSTVLKQLSDKAGTITEEAQKSAGEMYVKYGQKSIDKVNPQLFGFWLSNCGCQ